MDVNQQEQMIRVRLEPGLKERWDKVLGDRKISQQAAVVSLIEFVLSQEPITQSMIFGQVPEKDHGELAQMVLQRLGKRGRKR